MATAARPPTTPPAIAPVWEFLGPPELLVSAGGGGVLKVSSFSRPASLKPPEGARFVAPPLPLWG